MSTAASDREAPKPDEFAAVRDELRTMHGEIDALQAADAEKARPWFRQASVLISFLALLFSVGATVYSTQQAQRTEMSNARDRLGQLVQQLLTLPKENTELAVTYADNPAVARQLVVINQTQMSILARQAADIIHRIPGHVSADEYFGVGWALHQSGNPDLALVVYEEGLDVAEEWSTRTQMLQSYGELLMSQGELDSGRRQIQAAMEANDDRPELQRLSGDATIEAYWASIEKRLEQCGEARDHVGRARVAAARLSAGSVRDSVVAQIDAVTTPDGVCFR
jgi:tetratricopeptide (TPR) repeat protein